MKLYRWRDIDNEGRRYGFKLWWKGGEVSLGKRLYRFRIGEIPGTRAMTHDEVTEWERAMEDDFKGDHV